MTYIGHTAFDCCSVFSAGLSTVQLLCTWTLPQGMSSSGSSDSSESSQVPPGGAYAQQDDWLQVNPGQVVAFKTHVSRLS